MQTLRNVLIVFHILHSEGCVPSKKGLLQKLQTFPSASKQIQAWLKAGVLDGLEFTSTNEKGTLQGGIISPLLANGALRRLRSFEEGTSWNRMPIEKVSHRHVWTKKGKRSHGY